MKAPASCGIYPYGSTQPSNLPVPHGRGREASCAALGLIGFRPSCRCPHVEAIRMTSRMIVGLVLLFLLCSNASMSDRPASWRMPSAKQMEKPPPEAAGSIPLARAFGPSDDLPTEYWDAVLRDAYADAGPGGQSLVRTLRLSEISQDVLRVSCTRCGRIVDIHKADALRLYGPQARRSCSTTRAVPGLGATKKTVVGLRSDSRRCAISENQSPHALSGGDRKALKKEIRKTRTRRRSSCEDRSAFGMPAKRQTLG